MLGGAPCIVHALSGHPDLAGDRLSWRAAAERLDTICDRHRACRGRGVLAELLHSAPLRLGWRRVIGRLSATRKR